VGIGIFIRPWPVILFPLCKMISKPYNQTEKPPEYLDFSSVFRRFVVEVRGIEPLSEDSGSWLSPSADGVLNFPRPDARRQAAGFGSFILPGSPQSLGGPVPHINGASDASRERLRPTFAGLGRES